MESVCSETVSSVSNIIKDTGAAGVTHATAKRFHCMRKTIVCVEIDLPKPKTVDDVPVFAADILLQEKRRELGIEDEDDDSDEKSDVDAVNSSQEAPGISSTPDSSQKIPTNNEFREIADSAVTNGEIVEAAPEKADHVAAFGRSKITDIAEQLENKYKHAYSSVNRKKKALRLSKLGEGYDVDDAFVDDSDVIREYIPRNMQPEFGFYYVNSGPVKLVEVLVSDAEEENDSEDESDALSAPATVSDDDDESKKHKDDEALADDDASSDEDEDDTDDDEVAILHAPSKATQKRAASETVHEAVRSSLHLPNAAQSGSTASSPVKVSRKQLATKAVKNSTKAKEKDGQESKKFIVKKKLANDAHARELERKRKRKTAVADSEPAENKKHSKSLKKRAIATSPPSIGDHQQEAEHLNSEILKPKKKKMRVASASTDTSVLLPARKTTSVGDKVKLKKPKTPSETGTSSSSGPNKTSSVDAAISSVCKRVEKQSVTTDTVHKKHTNKQLDNSSAKQVVSKITSSNSDTLPPKSTQPEAATRSITIKDPIIRTAPIFQQCAVTPSSSVTSTRAASPASSHSSSVTGANRSSSKKRDAVSVKNTYNNCFGQYSHVDMQFALLPKPQTGVLSPPFSSISAESPGKLVAMNGPLRSVDPQSFFSQQMPQRPISGASSGGSISIIAAVKPPKQPKRPGLPLKRPSVTESSSNSSTSTTSLGETQADPKMPPPPMPKIENDMLRRCCHKLIKIINERQPGTGTTSFFNNSPEARRVLLDIEWRTLPIRSNERLAIYAHISAVLGLTKTSLAIRASREREKQVERLRSVTVDRMKKLVKKICGEGKNEVRTLLANSSWQGEMHNFIKFSRLLHGIPQNRRERPTVAEDDHIFDLFGKMIIDDVLTSHFAVQLFNANDNLLRQKTLLQLKQTYLGDNLPTSISVPSQLDDNFALVFDHGFVTTATSPIPTGGMAEIMKRTRPLSNTSSSSSTNDIAFIGASNKLTFKAEAKPNLPRNNNSSSSQTPTFQQPSTKKSVLPTSPVITGKQQRRIMSSQSSSSSLSDTASPAGFSVSAILSSSSSNSSNSDKQPSAFFAALNTSPPMRVNSSQQQRDSGSAASQKSQQQLFDLAAAAGLARPQPVNMPSDFSQLSPSQLMQLMTLIQQQPAVSTSANLSAVAASQQVHSWFEQQYAGLSQQAASDFNQQLLQMAVYQPQVLAQMLGIDAASVAALTQAVTSTPSSVPQVDFSNFFRSQQPSGSTTASFSLARSGSSSAAATGAGKTNHRIQLKNTGKPTSSINAARAPK